MNEWKVSLHGGHSGEFCDHAEGTLRQMLDAAVAFGYHTFGVSEHAPRLGEQYLYAKEISLGWTVAKIADDFERYMQVLPPLVAEYADRLVILRGFEAEVVPESEYGTLMRGYRERRLPDGSPAFDYMVGSIHFVRGFSIDGPRELYDRAIAECGGLAELMVEYYRQVAVMVETLRPEVVGHFDLVKLNCWRYWQEADYDVGALDREDVVVAARAALHVIRDYACILDLNTAGWRKGIGQPYPDSNWTTEAHALGIPFCFGDDSHRPDQAGEGIARARQFLLNLGIPTITVLTKDGPSANAPLVRRVVSLD